MNKKGADLAAEQLLRIIWILSVFFTIGAFIYNFSNSKIVEEEMYAIDSGLTLEALQAAPGDLAFIQDMPFGLVLKEGSVLASSLGSAGIKHDFARDSSARFVESTTPAGKVVFQKRGDQISMAASGSDGSQGSEVEKTRLACQKTGYDFALSKLNLTFDPGHGGVDTGFASGGLDESKRTQAIANAVKIQYSRQAGIRVTKESASTHMSVDERLDASRGSDILVTIHIGNQDNKGKVTIYAPQDNRGGESAILGCIIANELYDHYKPQYPIRTSLAGEYELMREGRLAAVRIELGSIDENADTVAIASSIFEGIKKYVEEK